MKKSLFLIAGLLMSVPVIAGDSCEIKCENGALAKCPPGSSQCIADEDDMSVTCWHPTQGIFIIACGGAGEVGEG